jgi:hypothetical protein
LISIVFVFSKKSLIVNFFLKFREEIAITLIIIIFTYFTEIWGDNQGRVVAYKHIVWFLESFFIPLFLISAFKDIFQEKSWKDVIITIGTIASIITLFLILNPSINLLVRSSIIIDSLDVMSGGQEYRGFTLSEGASYSYGIIQGLILVFCLLSVRENLLYALPILPLFISIIFNSRIGLAPVAIGFFLMFVSRQMKFQYLIYITILIGFGYWFVNDSSFAKQNSDSLEWSLSIFEDTSNLLKGEDDNSNYSVLSNQMFFLPDEMIGVLFGEGKDVFMGLDRNSDMGYVIQIFRGGVFYLLILLLFLWLIFKKCYLVAPDKIFSSLFLLTILIVNIKGDALFVSSGFFRLFVFYYIYSLSIVNKNTSLKINKILVL